MATFGNRPEDVVQDAHGNLVSGITLTYYANDADAQAQTNALGTVVTAAGRWTVSYGARVIYVREPNGGIYPVTTETGAQTVFVSPVADDPVDDPNNAVFDNDLWVQY